MLPSDQRTKRAFDSLTMSPLLFIYSRQRKVSGSKGRVSTDKKLGNLTKCISLPKSVTIRGISTSMRVSSTGSGSSSLGCSTLSAERDLDLERERERVLDLERDLAEAREDDLERDLDLDLERDFVEPFSEPLSDFFLSSSPSSSERLMSSASPKISWASILFALSCSASLPLSESIIRDFLFFEGDSLSPSSSEPLDTAFRFFFALLPPKSLPDSEPLPDLWE
ncbi:hypothetical protein FF38_00826 [Lucilia cuprina]|uniref:Uncharacterized protein n=1 Tax=Lucilia cuprina TaxID=7375 RepID=A0A0L0CD55_LUCCU|nr:hypothetical protein FF38_00826 [Lucilia cuprina]